MGEIIINNRDIRALKLIEVEQLLKEALNVSIAWVSKVGVWGTTGGYGSSSTH